MISLKLNSKTKKFTVVLSGLLVLIASGFILLRNSNSDNQDKSVCKNCNVILVSLDTLGSNHLPCYGYKRETATNLCNFAKENVFFTNSFSNAGWSLPSHYSIFTSLYPNHHGVIDTDSNNPSLNNSLDPKIYSMAQFFEKANYKTIYAGPLDDSSLPISRGMGRGFDSLINMKSWWSINEWQEAINQLKTNNKNKKNTFLFLHTYMVHDPYFVDIFSGGNTKRLFTNDYYSDIPLSVKELDAICHKHVEKIIKLYENELKNENIVDPKTGKTIVESLKGAKDDNEATQILIDLYGDSIIKNEDYLFFYDHLVDTNGKVKYVEALYDEMIYYLDKQLSVIFDLVSDTNLAKNTIIIITSDHGEAFKEHGFLVHPGDHLYNTTTSVPLVMYIPGIKQKTINNMVQGVDILPTLLNLTGVNTPKYKFDGIDLTGLIKGNTNAAANDYLISEGQNVDTIRDNQWKLYVKTNTSIENITYELYDLLNDPMEQKDISKQNQQIVKRLEQDLNRIIYKK